MDQESKEKFARFGIATKGFVYCLIGGLAVLTAFGLGGQTTDGKGALQFLAGQAFGKILLAITALGLIAYVFRRYYQAFANSDNKDDDAKGIAMRIAFFISGTFYGFLAYTAIDMLLNVGLGGGGQQASVSTLLDKPYGWAIIGAISLGLLVKAGYQFYRAYSGKFREKVKEAHLNPREQDLVIKSGKVGFTARGIVISIIAFLLFKAAFSSGSAQAGKGQAFEFMKNEFGVIIMAIVAAGLVAYGVFMFVKARYGELSLD